VKIAVPMPPGPRRDHPIGPTKNKLKKSGKFSEAENVSIRTTLSPAIHHKFTIKKPRSAPRFCQNPQQKRENHRQKKILQNRSIFG
jgi:hypothetical protein